MSEKRENATTSSRDSSQTSDGIRQHQAELAVGERFAFGRNWQRFLSLLSDERIAEAERSLGHMLGTESLAGKTFIDIGSGSGLFSLAAMRLGAQQVYSFDYDPNSVACSREIKARYFAQAENWTIEQGSVLDTKYMSDRGQWDIVYSWGVLHHTGNMRNALKNATELVRAGGALFIAIYNDQGPVSEWWRVIKRFYNKGICYRWLIAGLLIPFYFILGGIVLDVLRLRNPTRRYTEYKKQRGMSCVCDWYDWLGGYPFEVAKPEEIVDFCRERGFLLERLKTCGGRLGCNEFVFRKIGGRN